MNRPIVIAIAIVSGAMLWQIYKYTQTVGVGEPTSSSLQQSGHNVQQPENSDEGLEDVEPELYEKPASLKLNN